MMVVQVERGLRYMLLRSPKMYLHLGISAAAGLATRAKRHSGLEQEGCTLIAAQRLPVVRLRAVSTFTATRCSTATSSRAPRLKVVARVCVIQALHSNLNMITGIKERFQHKGLALCLCCAKRRVACPEAHVGAPRPSSLALGGSSGLHRIAIFASKDQLRCMAQ